MDILKGWALSWIEHDRSTCYAMSAFTAKQDRATQECDPSGNAGFTK